MKNILCIILGLLLFSTTYAQLDYPDFEIFTRTAGSSADTIRFWMLAEGPVWDGNERLTSSFDYAHATYWNDETVKGVPVPHDEYYYGIWSIYTLTSHPNHQYGYAKYKFLIGEEFYDPDMYFYIDYTDCDWTYYYDHADVWIKFDTDSMVCKISWDDDYFTPYTRIEQNEHPTLGIWDYKDKDEGHSGQRTDCFELYLTVTTQNNHPYLSWVAYDVRSGTNNVDYYEIWKKKDSGWFEKDTTSNTNYEDTSERCSVPGGVKKYVYYKIRAIELDEDASLYGNTVKKRVFDLRQEQKIFPLNENAITIKGGSPDKYTLRQNYPNPFNPTTNISFDLPEESSVQLQIFDIQGKLVSTLVNERMDKGNHSVSFNSDGLPSGVYFYRLSTKNFTDIKRMLLLK